MLKYSTFFCLRLAGGGQFVSFRRLFVHPIYIARVSKIKLENFFLCCFFLLFYVLYLYAERLFDYLIRIRVKNDLVTVVLHLRRVNLRNTSLFTEFNKWEQKFMNFYVNPCVYSNQNVNL